MEILHLGDKILLSSLMCSDLIYSSPRALGNFLAQRGAVARLREVLRTGGGRKQKGEKPGTGWRALQTEASSLQKGATEDTFQQGKALNYG